MPSSAQILPKWSKEQIDAECRHDYRLYERGLREHYTAYFCRHSQIRCAMHPYCARSLAAALPAGCAELKALMPTGGFHRFARSAKSSQMLALALLGSAINRDDSLRWFWNGLDLPISSSSGRRSVVRFEHGLAPSDLGEVPRSTKLDLSISSKDIFVAIETKWSEPGFGICSCARDGDGDSHVGFECAARVRSRRAYWEVAHELFGLEAIRLPFFPCSLSVAYQAVRNVAAARHLSRGRNAGFVLIYDENNPYFRQTGRWPGWPHMLRSILLERESSNFFFRTTSWQSLMPKLPLTSKIREWAREKHRL